MYTGKLVRLRRVEPARDTDDRYRWINDPVAAEWLAMRPSRVSRDEVRSYLEETAKSAASMVEFAVETLDGRHIGGTTLRNFNHVARSAEFAILIGEADYRGKGYGTDVAQLMLRIGFEEFNLNRIYLTAYAPNVGAIRAYEKAGYVREGLLRQHVYLHGSYHDAVYMAVLRSDWEAAKERAAQ